MSVACLDSPVEKGKLTWYLFFDYTLLFSLLPFLSTMGSVHNCIFPFVNDFSSMSSGIFCSPQ